MHVLQTTISAEPAPTRTRELETGSLVERAVRSRLSSGPGARFLARRAARDVASLEPSAARQALSRAVRGIDDAGEPWGCPGLSGALVSYGGVLEGHRQRSEAVAAFEAAMAVRPDDPELMLHAARAHRKAGSREAALTLYRRVRQRGDARLARFSSLGEALLSEDPEEALGRVLEEVGCAGDREVQGVALEERARLRRSAAQWAGAVNDLTAAALSYDDRRDRLRVAHELADLLLACGDLDAAREALVAALELSLPDERDHAVQRLRAVARAQGDELGLRRWPPAGRARLVSLMPARGPAAGAVRAASLAAVVRRWRDRLMAASD